MHVRMSFDFLSLQSFYAELQKVFVSLILGVNAKRNLVEMQLYAASLHFLRTVMLFSLDFKH